LAERRSPRAVDASTRTVGVIGWPVEHSLSPVIHNAAFAAMDMNWVYVPMPVEPGSLPAAVAGLAGLGIAGANLTMPHKTEAAALVEELSEDARRLSAVNTIVVGAGGLLVGHNTDAPGFDRFLRRDAGYDPSGRRALVFGAGGGARACALALAGAGLARLTVALREPARAAQLLAALDGTGLDVEVVRMDRAASVEADLVINATPLGAHGEELPLPALGPDDLAVDLIYRPAITPMQRTARASGAAALGGLGLLLHQAALSFELWTGREPPLEAMSAAALAALT
jgi:shikimate dehydrogenase